MEERILGRGTPTPLIVHWPKEFDGKDNPMNRGVEHVMDILSTCLKLVGAKYLNTAHGEKAILSDGKSMLVLCMARKSP